MITREPVRNPVALNVPRHPAVLYGVEYICLLYPLFSCVALASDPALYADSSASRFGPVFDNTLWTMLWLGCLWRTRSLLRLRSSDTLSLFAWNRHRFGWSLTTGILGGGYALGVTVRLFLSVGDLFLHPLRVVESIYGLMIGYVILCLRTLSITRNDKVPHNGVL